MNRALQEVLEKRGGNYILPFFWQHGENEEVLRKYMEVIQNAQINEVCLESRPHPDFAGPGWWHDVDIIMDEAVKRGMRVWILDDSHFPTGMAGGKMIQHDISLQKQYLMFKRLEVSGITPQMTIDIKEAAATRKSPFEDMMPASPFNHDPFKTWYDDDSLVRVIAYPCTRAGMVDMEAVDLTESVRDGKLEWDVPAGRWAVYVYYLTRNGGGKGGYINMLDEASCAVQIQEVYEPHYEHYKEYFGNTLAGFFSDEPCVGNCVGFDFDESVGRKNMPLPWCGKMPEMMEERLGKDWEKYAAALWTDLADKKMTARVRYAYMDSATRLIAESFSRQLGDWCEQRGVEYIGHIVEDKNQHSRLGSSQGHFFRSMEGQHMAGIDDIGGQVLPEGEHVNRQRFTGEPGASGEFYHFELGKLGSSYGHIDPRKKGRTMCEIFGAYGWSEGVRLEKYLADHFLVRGVNRYVPHAFSAKAFPDPDCPPHFYAHGHNPQYRHFGHLMGYMNRMCHLISGGKSAAPVAVLYHGEAEWTGECMFDETVACELMEHQLDLDILPSDVFAYPQKYYADLENGLCVNGITYQAFVIPYAEYLTKAVASFAVKAAKAGFPVYITQAYPSGICDTADDEEILEEIRSSGICVLPVDKLSEALRGRGIMDVTASPASKQLRYYHYEKDGAVFYLWNNESCGNIYEGTVSFPADSIYTEQDVALYEAMENRLYSVPVRRKGDRLEVEIKLAPCEEIVLVLDKGIRDGNLPVWKPERRTIMAIEGSWRVSTAEAIDYPDFKYKCAMDFLVNYGRVEEDFSGFIRYETSFALDEAGKDMILSIEDAYEGVEVWVNGEYAGMRITAPYEFAVGALVKEGTNALRIEVATTLERKMQNEGGGIFSMMGPSPIEPIGLIGEVCIQA